MCIYCQPVNTQPDPSLSVFGGDIYPPTVRIVDGNESVRSNILHNYTNWISLRFCTSLIVDNIDARNSDTS